MTMTKAIRPPRSQRGAVLLLVTFSAIVMLAFAAFALDISRMYIIKSQLQDAADAGALRAAKALDGTGQGVVGPNGALAKGIESALNNKFLLVSDPLESADLKVEVSADPAGPWTLASTVSATAANQYSFARVTATKGGIASFFGEFAGVWNAQATALAVAGRYISAITPIAVCAPDWANCPRATPGTPGGTCGFTVGKDYRVADLNPIGSGTPLWIDPLASSPPCTVTSANDTRPYLCVGKSAIRFDAQYVYTNTGWTNSQFASMDSRFGVYDPSGKCTSDTAPPDQNVMQYFCATGGPAAKDLCTLTKKPGHDDEVVANWMQFQDTTLGSPTTGAAYSQSAVVADNTVQPMPIDNSGIMFSFRRPDASIAIPGRTPPTDPTKYPSGTATPYTDSSGPYWKPPPNPSIALANRRVMNLVIVNCQAAGGVCHPAEVGGIGTFLLTRQTNLPTDKNMYIEFGGIVQISSINSEIRLYR